MFGAKHAAEKAAVLLLRTGILKRVSLSSEKGEGLGPRAFIGLFLPFVHLFLERFGFLFVRE
jgi:hypothetical protein